jgi:hypothetical protein
MMIGAVISAFVSGFCSLSIMVTPTGLFLSSSGNSIGLVRKEWIQLARKRPCFNTAGSMYAQWCYIRAMVKGNEFTLLPCCRQQL